MQLELKVTLTVTPAFKKPLITPSQQQEKTITQLTDWRKIPLDTNPPELSLFLH